MRRSKPKPLPIGLIAGVAAPCLLALVGIIAWATSGSAPEASAVQPKEPVVEMKKVPAKPVNPFVATRAAIAKELAAVVSRRQALETEDQQLVETIRGLNLDKQFPATERRRVIKAELESIKKPEEDLRAKLAAEDQRRVDYDILHP